MKKTRKLFAVVLALVMTLALAAPAFAADTVVQTTGETTLTVTTVLNLPTIKVTIAPVNNVVVNPYKLSYNSGGLTGTAQIISKASSIKNESGIKMSIKATPSLNTDSNDLTILTSAPAAGSTDKALYLALNMAPVADADAAAAYAGTGTGTVTAAVKKVGSTPLSSATIELDVGSTTATWGAILFTGATSGSGWVASDEITALTIVFDIQPVVGTTPASP